ncbi:hypothetical protein C7974DRAFT_409334 [Boeremia exigua]|uniref:uncharacterized protein n=1 Tax=Boeremia exigua TaxID=749465 RepID=UPI001E8DB317|nr:uncharacterized protein C7974DRAFT_409334 [Boeremia exigua]KAH6642812.1 hypothetical protein C7974DRAFT_409334 [Boeremia exigua]
MGLPDLPPELQVMVYENLEDDYDALMALTTVSRAVADCAHYVLEPLQTLDLSDGCTDEIEDNLIRLYELAYGPTSPVPQVTFRTIHSDLGQNLIRQASAYRTLVVHFDSRYGFTQRPAIRPENMVKLEAMWALLNGSEPYSPSTWRRNVQNRLADTSLRLVFRTMRHLTTLELGGSTNILPWKTAGILPMLRTLKFTAITNPKLSPMCWNLAARPHLVTLEFSNMSITTSFLANLKNDLPVTDLRFRHCWVEINAFRRFSDHCKRMEAFEYTLGAYYWPVAATKSKHHHLASLVSQMHRHANKLTHLTLLMPNVEMDSTQCNHVVSLAQFTALQKLAISYKVLAPHTRACGVYVANPNTMLTQWDILSGLAPSVDEVHLYRGDEADVMLTLSGMVNSMGPNMLPNLRRVEVILSRLRSPFSVSRSPGTREVAIRKKFERRGVVVLISRPKHVYPLD